VAFSRGRVDFIRDYCRLYICYYNIYMYITVVCTHCVVVEMLLMASLVKYGRYYYCLQTQPRCISIVVN